MESVVVTLYVPKLEVPFTETKMCRHLYVYPRSRSYMPGAKLSDRIHIHHASAEACRNADWLGGLTWDRSLDLCRDPRQSMDRTLANYDHC